MTDEKKPLFNIDFEEDPTINTMPDAGRRKPGRPKGSTNTTTPRTAGPATDVKKALATMQGLYEGVAGALMLFGLPGTASTLVSRIEQVQVQNEQAFSASPKLAKAIANVGQTGGVAAFFIGNAVMVAGVVAVGRQELAMKRPPEPETTENETEPPVSDGSRY